MSTKHTPGPWAQSHRHKPNGMYDTEVYCAEGHTIATIAWYPTPKTPDGVTATYREANARLIAAAPDLYDAADNALNALIGCCVPAGGVDDRKTMLEAQAMLRAAIAKAAGSAQ